MWKWEEKQEEKKQEEEKQEKRGKWEREQTKEEMRILHPKCDLNEALKRKKEVIWI